ncbi:MAG: bifunctional folylpolyglutamate synthase/dihydrofolate synthase [Fimbriimonadaceae bacterium]|nr:bifunctional folylpolyglutamate synthase/dihydrofolate synthase [Fimbriimonadaceae bacterium]
MTFDEAVAALGSFEHRGWRLGLDRMDEFLRRLGLADSLGKEGGPQFIHVAGTNGKGSVTAFVQSLLVAQGYRTGATFSPFVYDVRERVMINRDLIPKDDFARLVPRLIEVGAMMEDTDFGGPTEFEMKTALGFLYWAEKRCDAVALEVGLGGRLDATNVVNPRASVIVSIGYDHMEYLGSTLAEIAREKAGIIKPGRPVIVGAMAEEALMEIEEVAAETGSEMWRFGKEIALEPGAEGWSVTTPAGGFGPFNPPLKGVMQPANAALAIGSLAVSGLLRNSAAIPDGIRMTKLPGRFEERSVSGQRWVLDGAHNAAAAATLGASLRQNGYESGLTLITGMLQGHNPAVFADVLAPMIRRVLVAPIKFHRSQTSSEVALAWRALGKPVQEFDSVADAVLAACNESAGDVLVTGSFYLLSEVDSAITNESRSQ